MVGSNWDGKNFNYLWLTTAIVLVEYVPGLAKVKFGGTQGTPLISWLMDIKVSSFEMLCCGKVWTFFYIFKGTILRFFLKYTFNLNAMQQKKAVNQIGDSKWILCFFSHALSMRHPYTDIHVISESTTVRISLLLQKIYSYRK